MKKNQVVVVGAGAAGMMAALRAAECGAGVVLIDKNPLCGKKLLLSGKGRCNLTNTCDLDSFLTRFSNNGQFLRDAFRAFFSHELMEFFQRRGLALKVERQQRVFPVTDRSSSIVSVLEKELSRLRVVLMLKSPVKALRVAQSRAKAVVLNDGSLVPADAVIVATGGMSYAFTGSTGDGLRWAQELGHRSVAVRPGLVPLVTHEEFVKRVEGVVLKNIRLRFSCAKKEIVSEIGEVLFTRFGISGPVVLSLSGRVVDWLADGQNVSVEIDLKPALSPEQLHQRLLREFTAHAGKSVKNVCASLLPRRMVDVFLEVSGIPAETKANQVTVTHRAALVDALKHFRLTVTRPLPLEEAMVTRGGVSLKDVNPRTMESRLVKGLYFAGEVLDIDADTGGFNLQAAFSTGYLAGESAALAHAAA